MQPVLLRWHSFSLYWYTALMCLGILLAVGYAQWQGYRGTVPKNRRQDTLVLDAALWVLVGGLVGARLAYVIPNWVDYAGRPVALLSFWGGGLVFQGGLVGGTVGLLLYALWAELSFFHLVDLAAPAVALAQSLGWAGAHLHGANYGLVMRSDLSMWLPDLYGVYGPRFPTQMLASMFGLLLFFQLHEWRQRRLPPGTVALLYLLLNGLGHFFLEFTRADEAPYVGLLRVTQVAELLEVVFSGVLLWYVWRVARGKARPAHSSGGVLRETGE
jgi:phosphatidylglycerol:prolipoprotein diacylglycerol transferase